MKLHVLFFIVTQLLFVANAFSLDFMKERDLLWRRVDNKIAHFSGVEISNQYRLWLFVKPENYLNDQINDRKTNKQKRVYRYTFYTALSDTNGNIIDNKTETKNYDKHIHEIDRNYNRGTFLNQSKKNGLLYDFRVIFGINRNIDGDAYAGDTQKSYIKLFVYAIENGRINKVVDNLTESVDQVTWDESKCNGSNVVSTSNLSLLNQLTNGKSDFTVETTVKTLIYEDCKGRTEIAKTSEIYKFDGKLYRSVNTAVVQESKAPLFDSPSMSNQPKMYLVKGDYVVIRDRKVIDDTEWVLVDYDSAALGNTISKWMIDNTIKPLKF
jgi:hypothetical protein